MLKGIFLNIVKIPTKLLQQQKSTMLNNMNKKERNFNEHLLTMCKRYPE
ncbi:hypothetical protein CAXC1_120068 [Candidatus Xenohaliotis californiensis]|uniref:Uncharacterized protein n=1 Tax=Candidatus Xenohaliotis californiensis TaxID=84677 RepID=A0ABP0EUV1_9RICK|nr:hypothetical protein CAXC1_120068 [Candidatus Xenohaliotis californiensis]